MKLIYIIYVIHLSHLVVAVLAPAVRKTMTTRGAKIPLQFFQLPVQRVTKTGKLLLNNSSDIEYYRRAIGGISCGELKDCSGFL